MRPETEAELAEIIAGAAGPLHVRGGGTRVQGAATAGAVLETGGLTGITLYEPGALTLVVKAGTPLAEVETALAAEGQRLAFEPMDHRPLLGTKGEPTIGGVVAANVSGPRRIQAGACRDFMLGVRFVDGTGQVVKNGGRVMKNVTGYDLVKLMTGSRGTLGVLTEVSLKVLPAPSAEATLILDGLDTAAAVRAMAAALGSPFEVTGAAHLPVGDDGPATFLRIEGLETSVAYRREALAQALANHGTARIVVGDDSRAAWARLRDVRAMDGFDGDVWRISCRPSEAPALAERLGADRLQLDWGGGLVWAGLPAGTDARGRLGAFDGHATLVRAVDPAQRAIPAFHPQSDAVAVLAKGIRARFDPRGILNPGLMDA